MDSTYTSPIDDPNSGYTACPFLTFDDMALQATHTSRASSLFYFTPSTARLPHYLEFTFPVLCKSGNELKLKIVSIDELFDTFRDDLKATFGYGEGEKVDLSVRWAKVGGIGGAVTEIKLLNLPAVLRMMRERKGIDVLRVTLRDLEKEKQKKKEADMPEGTEGADSKSDPIPEAGAGGPEPDEGSGAGEPEVKEEFDGGFEAGEVFENGDMDEAMDGLDDLVAGDGAEDAEKVDLVGIPGTSGCRMVDSYMGESGESSKR